jgi:small subunit ribosomal protein S16
VAVKIKLKRLGKIRSPHYRIIVADSRTRRDGRAIEEIGLYHPVQNPSRIEVDSERVQYWLGVGAQPTEPVTAILKVTGDWQKFKGLPAPEPMKVAEPKADKKALFEAAAKESSDQPKGEAITPKAKKSDKGEKKADEAKAESAEAATESTEA